jgi:hypothetical protein
MRAGVLGIAPAGDAEDGKMKDLVFSVDSVELRLL